MLDLPRPDDPEWIKANPGSSYVCSKCGGKTTHVDRWDAYACHACNRWEEAACADPRCAFCSTRPPTPA